MQAGVGKAVVYLGLAVLPVHSLGALAHYHVVEGGNAAGTAVLGKGEELNKGRNQIRGERKGRNQIREGTK